MTEETKQNMFEQVYNQIYSMLCFTTNEQNENSSNKVIQLGLNIPIDPSQYQGMLEPGNPDGDLSKTRAFSLLVDQIPSLGTIGGATGKSLASVYSNVINYANTTDKSTEEQEKRYKEAKAVLFKELKEVKNPDYEEDDSESSETITILEPTSAYNAYLLAKNQYDNAVANYAAKYTPELSKTIAGQAILKKFQAKIDNAYNKLQIVGAAEIEKALAQMATAMNEGLSGFIAEQKQLLKSAAFLSEDKVKWYATYPVPSANVWLAKTAQESRDKKIEDYILINQSRKNEILSKLEQVRSEMVKAEEQGKDIGKYEDKIQKLEEELEELENKVAEKTEEITAEYADKIENQTSGFIDFEFNTKSYNATKHESSANYKLGLTLGLGLFNLGGKGSAQKSNIDISEQNINVIIRGQLATVQIIRPWFEPTIFQLKGWTNSLFKKNELSSGRPDDKNAILPMYTTSLILMKNLSVEADFTSLGINKESLDVNGNAGISFGPFVIGPKYSSSREDYSCIETENGFKLTNHGVQIIGYVNEIVPACPNADDPSLKV